MHVWDRSNFQVWAIQTFPFRQRNGSGQIQKCTACRAEWVCFAGRPISHCRLFLADMLMKTLHVISTLTPRFGGTTTVVRTLSAYQARARLNVTVCTTNGDSSTSGKMPVAIGLLEDGVTCRYFPAWSPLLIAPAMGRWFKNHLRQFDIVHIHGLYRFPVSSAAWWARKTGVPYMIMPHGSLDPFLYNQSQYNLPLKKIYERLFDIPNLNHATAIHYTTEEEAKRAAFLRLRSRAVVLPNGIDWENYRRLPPRGNFRRYIRFDDQTPLVLFLGRINFKKGLDLLVPAFGRVTKKRADARLAIVGPDNEGYCSKVRRWCKEYGIQDRVFFVDHLGFEKVKEAYVDADCFVLPSYTENFGLTVVEAMACGTPVIISDQVNIWREVQEARAGIVVRLDSRDVADAICRILADKIEAKAMGTRGRVAAEKCYAWPHIVEQLTQVYRELIEEKMISKWASEK